MTPSDIEKLLNSLPDEVRGCLAGWDDLPAEVQAALDQYVEEAVEDFMNSREVKP